MYDYDAEYRRLRAAGLPGWAETSMNAISRAWSGRWSGWNAINFPKPPAKVLELGCGNGQASSQWMARRGYARAASVRCRVLPRNLSTS